MRHLPGFVPSPYPLIFNRVSCPARSDANRAKCACAPGFCFPLQDSITKYYFDKKPFRPHGYCGNKCCYKEPKLEVVHGGCMCCCVHINPGPPCFAPKNSVSGSVDMCLERSH
jgi:hypothetical protein